MLNSSGGVDRVRESKVHDRNQNHMTEISQRKYTKKNNERVKEPSEKMAAHNEKTNSIIVKNRKSKCSVCLEIRENIRFPVYVVVMLFAMSTWLTVSGIWVEMPLLVQVLPESWSLPSILIIIIQCANLGPATYGLIRKMQSSAAAKKKKEEEEDGTQTKMKLCLMDVDVMLIFLNLFVLTIAMFLLSLVWMMTWFIADSHHSVPLFLLLFLSSLVCCTSSVMFLPYMARFPPSYISAYYFGQGLSGMLPGFLGLIQGLGKEPECILPSLNKNETSFDNMTFVSLVVLHRPPIFSVSIFFGILTFFLIVSIVAFYFLNFSDLCKAEMVVVETNVVAGQRSMMTNDGSATMKLAGNGNCATEEDTITKHELLSLEEEEAEKKEEERRREEGDCFLMRHRRFICLLITMGVLSALTNGLLPSTQSYTCLPYGQLVYTLSIRLSSISGPIASLTTIFIPSSSLFVINALMSAAILFAIFHLVLAGHSPDRLIQDDLIGKVIIIMTSVMMMSLFSYVRATVGSLLRKDGGKRGLLCCGAVTQIGSFCGAILAFIFVKIDLFQKRDICSDV